MSPRSRAQRLEQTKRALSQAPPAKHAVIDLPKPDDHPASKLGSRCPVCGLGHMRFAGQRSTTPVSVQELAQLRTMTHKPTSVHQTLMHQTASALTSPSALALTGIEPRGAAPSDHADRQPALSA